MMDAVPEPAATMIPIAAFTGCRRGEIRGMRWEDYNTKQQELGISQSIWHGIATDPKTEKSKAPIPIITHSPDGLKLLAKAWGIRSQVRYFGTAPARAFASTASRAASSCQR